MKKLAQNVIEVLWQGGYYYFANERGVWHIHVSDSRFEPTDITQREVYTLDVYPEGFKTFGLAYNVLRKLPPEMAMLYFEEPHNLAYETIVSGGFVFLRKLLWSTGVQRYDCNFATLCHPNNPKRYFGDWLWNEVEHVSSCTSLQDKASRPLETFAVTVNDDIKARLQELRDEVENSINE